MSVVMLSSENRQLFGEQVNDHIAKLNDLMGFACGQPLDRTPVEKTTFAGRLLEGSTRMLGLDEWCSTLTMFRELLERFISAGRHWDEQVSQIVSEILETEEQAVTEILADEDGEIDLTHFGGLQQEIELILSEPFGRIDDTPSEPGVSIEKESEQGEESLFEMPAGESNAEETVQKNTEAESGESTGCKTNGFATITRLQSSLKKIDDRLEECLSEGNRGDAAVRDLELAIGESEFFMAMLGSMLSRLGDNQKTFRSKVSSSTVMDGLNDFIGIHSRLRNWKTELRTRTDDFSLEREAATDLAVILENCVFDICRMSERSNRRDISVKIDVSSEGSYLTARVFDDASDYLNDSEIDRDDAMAYYHGLLQARGLLRKWGALLWVEPGDGSEDRFRFTFPRTSVITDYHLIDSAGMTFAVPKHSVDNVIDLSSIQIDSDQGGRSVRQGGSRIPVCRIDELAADELDAGSEGNHVVILGLAEKRIGILSEGPGRKVEGLIEQVTENGWASLSGRLLHIGEREFPVLDIQLVIDRYSWVQGFEEETGETGSWVDEVVEVS
jgi:chemotaxis protein histidine kinase CheA